MSAQPIVAECVVLRWERSRFQAQSAAFGPVAERLTRQRAAGFALDRWSRKSFRQAAVRELREGAAGGLVIVATGSGIPVPPPFAEHFEPVQLGAGDPQLQTIVGPELTRDERVGWYVNRVLVGMVGAIVLFALGALFFRSFRLPGLVTLVFVGAVGAMIAVIHYLANLTSEWHLLPGAVAVIRPGARAATKLRVLRRDSACAMLRYVSNGKTTMLVLELWEDGGRIERRTVTDREAIAFLATWRSPLPSPGDARLQELVEG